MSEYNSFGIIEDVVVVSSETVRQPSQTKETRDALVPEEGAVIYNSDTATTQVYNGVSWVSVSNAKAVQPVSAATYTVEQDDDIVLCDATTTAIALTLPLASTMSGQELVIIKTDSSSHTVVVGTTNNEWIATRSNHSVTLSDPDSALRVLSVGSQGWYLL